MNPRVAPHNTRPLRRARTLAALRELDAAIDFGWRDFAAFRARPFDWTRDLPPAREGAQNGSRGAREAA